MKVNDPFGLNGHLDIDAGYSIDSRSRKFSLSNSGSAEVTESPEWKSFDSIELTYTVEYKVAKISKGLQIGFPSMGVGQFSFKATWIATFSDSGLELAQDGVQPRNSGTNKSDGEIVVAAGVRLAESKPGAKKPFIELAVGLVAADDDQGISVGFSNGPISAGTSIGGHKGSGSEESIIRLYLHVNQPAAAPAQVAIPKIPPSLLTPDPILFKEDEDTLSSESTRELHEWVSKVKDNESLGAVIALGDLPIQIQAFASTTGTEKYNKGETDRRLQSVEKILKSAQFFGSAKLQFDEKSHGKEKADGKGAKHGFNRRVEVLIDHNKATKAIAKFLDAK